MVCWALAAIAQTTIPPISTTQNSQRQGDRAMGVPGLFAAIRSGRGRCSWLSGPDRRNKAVRFARHRGSARMIAEMREHSKNRQRPAAGMADRLWEVADMVEGLEIWEATV